MKCAVLGRGKSLGLWNAIPAKPIFKFIYLVNNCSEEVRRIGLSVEDYDHLDHVCGRKGATILDKDVYEDLCVGWVRVNALGYQKIENVKRMLQRFPIELMASSRPNCMLDRGYPPIGWKKLLKGVTEAAPKSDNGNCWPTTGLYAIDLMLTAYRPSELWLFGFDFYSQSYMIKPNRSYQTQKNPKVKMMYVYLQKLVDEFKDTQFYSASDLGMKGDNWHLILK